MDHFTTRCACGSTFAQVSLKSRNTRCPACDRKAALSAMQARATETPPALDRTRVWPALDRNRVWEQAYKNATRPGAGPGRDQTAKGTPIGLAVYKPQAEATDFHRVVFTWASQVHAAVAKHMQRFEGEWWDGWDGLRAVLLSEAQKIEPRIETLEIVLGNWVFRAPSMTDAEIESCAWQQRKREISQLVQACDPDRGRAAHVVFLYS